MAQMTLTDLTTQAKDHIANVEAGRVTRAANMALRRLYAVAGPTVRYGVTTVAPYSTGTIALAQGDTAVTLTGGTFAAATTNQLFRASGESTWYGWTYGSASAGTIAPAFAGTTLTVGTYKIAYAYYDLPTTISSTFDLWRDSRNRLRRVTDEEASRYIERLTEPGQPEAYAVVKGTHASNSAVRIMLLPYPDAVYTFTAAGRARPTLFTGSGTEYSGLPEDYDDALLAGTLFYLWDGEGKQSESQWWKALWQETLNNASATQNEAIVTQYGQAVGRARLWNADVADGP